MAHRSESINQTERRKTVQNFVGFPLPHQFHSHSKQWKINGMMSKTRKQVARRKGEFRRIITHAL